MVGGRRGRLRTVCARGAWNWRTAARSTRTLGVRIETACQMTPRQYKLHLTFLQKFQAGFPAIMATVAPLLFYFAFRSFDEGQVQIPDQGAPDYFPYLFFWIFAAIYWWEILTLPHTMNVNPHGHIEFISLLRRREISASNIVSIRPEQHGFITAVMGGFVVKHSGGKIAFINQFTGMHELLAELRQSNPAVELVGC